MGEEIEHNERERQTERERGERETEWWLNVKRARHVATG